MTTKTAPRFALPLLLLAVLFLATVAMPATVQAQEECWTCNPVFYLGDDCWIDSCTWTDGAGESNCSQSGECGDLDTCDENGDGCEGVHLVLLDGRSSASLTAGQVRELLADPAPEDLTMIASSREGGTDYLRLTCNGALIHAVYSPGEAAKIREVTTHLAL